jgi:hypothetical protein
LDLNSYQDILVTIQANTSLSSGDIFQLTRASGRSYSTLKRHLALLISLNLLLTKGTGRGTKYVVSPEFELLRPIDLEQYFEKNIDDRTIRDQFNFSLLRNILPSVQIFTASQYEKLSLLQYRYLGNISGLSRNQYLREVERLGIDLS